MVYKLLVAHKSFTFVRYKIAALRLFMYGINPYMKAIYHRLKAVGILLILYIQPGLSTLGRAIYQN